MIDIHKYAVKNKIISASAINHKEFRDFFKTIKIKTAVEIGTNKGMSAAYIAHFVKKVFTFDIRDYPQKYKAWNDLGVENKIFYYTIKNQQDIKEILDKIRFDFAFIDGAHTYKDVKADFELVKRCGRVLFHDVSPYYKGKKHHRHDGIIKFINELGNIKITGNIGYWVKGGK